MCKCECCIPSPVKHKPSWATDVNLAPDISRVFTKTKHSFYITAKTTRILYLTPNKNVLADIWKSEQNINQEYDNTKIAQLTDKT